jgi:N4-(beta-N-acetylglucosaminyl)-L-asparaginase
MNRRKFIGLSALTAPAFAVSEKAFSAQVPGNSPVVISTWESNTKANAAAWEVLKENGSALNAVHQGVMVPEADPEDQSVGYGGLPDRDGRVTLDACMMDHLGNCGAVMALEYIKHPSSVARLVMEKTPHVQIVGDGALQLALANGFKKEDLLTPKSKADWQAWLKESKYDPMITVDNILEHTKGNHDTIGMIALDNAGNLSGACSTSGLAYKMHGRVGDSPIIGAGLFVDNEVGAASATGIGEEVVRIVGSHTIVEMMRNGKSPEEACKEAVRRLVKLRGEQKARTLQIGFIALNKGGEYGCFAMNDEFTMAVHTNNGPEIIKVKSWFAS